MGFGLYTIEVYSKYSVDVVDSIVLSTISTKLVNSRDGAFSTTSSSQSREDIKEKELSAILRDDPPPQIKVRQRKAAGFDGHAG